MALGEAATDPTAEPEASVATDVRTGEFQLLDTRPEEGYENVTGTAVIERPDQGTTVRFDLQGLPPGGHYMSHVHEGSCAEYGGDHHRHDPAAGSKPPNEIHLHFNADAEGNAQPVVENPQVATEQAISVVLHPMEAMDRKIACAEFGPAA